MSQVCSQCTRLNPPAAIYCWFDGIPLAGRVVDGKRIKSGSQPFPSQFVFPSGQACHTFDQLAIACQENWTSAVELLRKGIFTSFLGALGRGDLAVAAQEAARFPDADRGLDRLLAQFPTRVLAAPKLRVEPTGVSLGVIPFGIDRSFELHLDNLGMRLLYGSVTSDCKWLTLGDAPGNPQKLFQFGGDAVVHVQIRGQKLRAGSKPLEGHLLVESNGGVVTVTVRAEVPVKPYPSGPLAGAATPRQIAEKAQIAPKETASLFENGAVAQWFASNGWVYPVQGPSASGVGAVQQFFEALGLAKAPKIEVNPPTLILQGEVGQSLQSSLELRTQEKRPVYGHAVCDQPWLEVGRATLSGRNAVLRVSVPRVPNRPGETLQAQVRITSNGNQKFRVPISLQIGGRAPREVASADAVPVAVLLDAAPRPTSRQYTTPSGGGGGRLLLAGLLVLILCAILVGDFFWTPTSAMTIEVESQPRIAVFFDEDNPRQSHLGSMRFGLVALERGGHPEKKLTYSKTGESNSTVLMIDGNASVLGFPVAGESRWFAKHVPIRSPWLAGSNNTVTGMKSVWLYDDPNRTGAKVRVTQTVEIVPGPAEQRSGKLKRWLDTCLVRYTIENVGKIESNVGLRVLVDTLIGKDDSNDGVPFTVPGEQGLVNRFKNFETPGQKIPDFLQVLENPDLAKPGIVGFMSLNLGEGVERPTRVLLTHWPTQFQNWDVPERPFLDDPKEPADSAVVLYWNEKPLAVGAKRVVGFSYGLGRLSIAGGQLGISVGGNFTPKGELTVQALVERPQQGQTLTLKLPAGLRLVEGNATQTVPQIQEGAVVQQSPVTWRIASEREGTFMIEVLSSTGLAQKKTITIKAKTIF